MDKLVFEKSQRKNFLRQAHKKAIFELFSERKLEAKKSGEELKNP
jgi:hypothetical protein